MKNLIKIFSAALLLIIMANTVSGCGSTNTGNTNADGCCVQTGQSDSLKQDVNINTEKSIFPARKALSVPHRFILPMKRVFTPRKVSMSI